MSMIQKLMLGGFLLMALLPCAQAQTCNDNMGTTLPDSLFSDNGDGTITDNRTQLMWKQCSEGQSSSISACDTGSASSYSWGDIGALVLTINSTGFAGYTDWRLPNRNELATLVERQCYTPAVNKNLFGATEASNYWSSTPYSTFGSYAWAVSFDHGGVQANRKTTNNHVRLVRNVD